MPLVHKERPSPPTLFSYRYIYKYANKTNKKKHTKQLPFKTNNIIYNFFCLVWYENAQAEVGKVRRRCFTLPTKDFTYGMRSVCLDGGATEGMSVYGGRVREREREREPEIEREREILLAHQLYL